MSELGVVLGVVLLLLFFPIMLIYLGMKNKKKQLEEYEKIPTLDEYISQNPNCKTVNGFKCNNCGSKSIKNWGLTGTKTKIEHTYAINVVQLFIEHCHKRFKLNLYINIF